VLPEVQREGAVALAPDPVMPAGEAVVRGEQHDRVLQESLRLHLGQHPGEHPVDAAAGCGIPGQVVVPVLDRIREGLAAGPGTGCAGWLPFVEGACGAVVDSCRKKGRSWSSAAWRRRKSTAWSPMASVK